MRKKEGRKEARSDSCAEKLKHMDLNIRTLV